jgi:hypothetical protein
MTRRSDPDNPPLLLCGLCKRPMDFVATLPPVGDRPPIHAYRCLPCRRVDTVTPEPGPGD